jgi:formylglycine-generating enzyme required for sulfatase activity
MNAPLRSLTLVLAAAGSMLVGLVPADAGAARSPSTSMATIGAGTYRPLFPPTPSEATIPVPAFRLDRTPVTNRDYLAFVRSHPEWRRDRIAPALAEPTYLGRWESADELGPDAAPEQAVVAVSWFSSRAYCAAHGRRLPTEAEWEVAASASATRADASADPAWRAEVLARYLQPMPSRLPSVGAGVPNFWGLFDMTGPVWEWVQDFQTAAASLAGSDRRFCGGGGGSAASDAMDFAAFERVAMRSALHARYTTKSLGFRCAADGPSPGAR